MIAGKKNGFFFSVYKNFYYTVYLHILWYMVGGEKLIKRKSSEGCWTRILNKKKDQIITVSGFGWKLIFIEVVSKKKKELSKRFMILSGKFWKIIFIIGYVVKTKKTS